MGKNSKQMLLFPFVDLGTFEIAINDHKYVVQAAICSHGVRFKTYVDITLEGQLLRQKVLYFGEGEWLQLPSIEDAVTEHMGGTAEDATVLAKLYDDHLSSRLPELITGGYVKDFIQQEKDRLLTDNGNVSAVPQS